MNRGRKITGGKYHRFRKKRLFQRIIEQRQTTLGETKSKSLRLRGGNKKTILLKTNIANVTVAGKAKKAEILNVEETPQNKFFARQNKLMKGAVIETSLGKAKITNRPSQENCVNAILLKQ